MSKNPSSGSEPVLRIAGLSVEYRTDSGSVRAVDDVTFDVVPGEVFALVGESGSGKSTTVQTLVGLLPSSARITAGAVHVAGKNIVGLSERATRRALGSTVGYVPQDPTVSLDPVKTVGRQVAEVFRIHERLNRTAARLRSVELLDRVGIDRAARRFDQYPHELSGGMRQRVLIAIALAVSPGLIVADEPTSGLDVTVQRRILDQLEALAVEGDLAMLLVTHDLGVVRDRGHRVAVMDKGRIVESGAVSDVFRTPSDPYTRRLLDAVPANRPTRAERVRPPAVAQRSAPSGARVTEPPASASATTQPAGTTHPAGPAAGPILRATGLTKRYHLTGPRGRREALIALDDVSLALGVGKTLGVVGESGSGKSTLARIISGLTEPSAGEVLIGGERTSDLHGAARRERLKRVQYVYQNPFASLDPRFTVERTIAEPLRAWGVGDKTSRREEVARLLDLVALPASYAGRTAVELSGGQRQRVAIARALALTPELVVLDEPVSALDVSVQSQVLDLLLNLQEDVGLTYVFISHDLAVVRLLADETLVLQRGKVTETGPTEEIFANPADPYTVNLIEAIPGSARTH